MRCAWVPTEPLCFTGYGPGGAAGAGAKAGYPTGTGEESLTPLPAKGALMTQVPELWGWPRSLQKSGQPTLHSDPSRNLCWL